MKRSIDNSLGVLANTPSNVSFLAKNPSFEMGSDNIEFYVDEELNLLKIKSNLNNDYYEDYLMTTSFSEANNELQNRQLESLLSFAREYDYQIESFVEVGCGDGAFLEKASSIFSRAVGIEPSKRFSSTAIERGLNVINGYVSSETSLVTDKFDSFVSRQVFEHLENPLDVMLGIREMLNANAIGLIEVPNGLRALNKGRFYEFFPDHVNYFSVNSLVMLAEKSGFEVLSCQVSFGGDYLELWVKNVCDLKQLVSNLSNERSALLTDIKKMIISLKDRGDTVSIWGCGAKTISIFAAGLQQLEGLIDSVIDSDPNKVGRYIPNTSIQVVSPSYLAQEKRHSVIILALSYMDEIRKAIESTSMNVGGIFSVVDNKIVLLNKQYGE